MVHFIEKIKFGANPIDWGTLLIGSLNIHLTSVPTESQLYMTSYIIYLLVTQQPTYLGLTRKWNMQDANAKLYIVYPMLVRKPLQRKSLEFRIINDASIFLSIRFLEVPIPNLVLP